MPLLIIHQAVRVVLRSGRSGSRSGDGQHKPTLNCPENMPHDDVDGKWNATFTNL